MKAKEVARGVYQVGLRGVNVFLVEAGDDLVLVDAGLRKSPARITEAIYGLGRLPQDVRAIVVTHAHPDHVGGLAEMQRRTGAEVWMHPADAALVREGILGRPLEAGPSRRSRAVVGVLGRWSSRQGEAVVVAHETGDDEVLPFGGLRAVHTPGHTAGHLALLLPREGGVLFVGDAANHMVRLTLGALHEQAPESRRSIEKLAALEFEAACFAHGRAIRHGASAAFGELARRLDAAAVKAPPVEAR
jgi:glyoxylase-like metal-dependent hydrolase (beta-lactamase superfamily II)